VVAAETPPARALGEKRMLSLALSSAKENIGRRTGKPGGVPVAETSSVGLQTFRIIIPLGPGWKLVEITVYK